MREGSWYTPAPGGESVSAAGASLLAHPPPRCQPLASAALLPDRNVRAGYAGAWPLPLPPQCAAAAAAARHVHPRGPLQHPQGYRPSHPHPPENKREKVAEIKRSDNCIRPVKQVYSTPLFHLACSCCNAVPLPPPSHVTSVVQAQLRLSQQHSF